MSGSISGLRPTPRQYRLMSGGRLAAISTVVPPRHLDGATRLDVVGAVTVTAATGSFIYGMLNAGEKGWTDLGTPCPAGPPSSCTGCSCSSSAPYRLP